MLRRVYSDQPRQRHRFVDPLLIAYRKASKESIGFVPFEVLYGRTVKGLIKILKELGAEDVNVPKVTTGCQCVL